ncbi:MAG: efflux RND transporter periplasmic adaptor subunit, partial [Parachlamydiaceae bacterium]
DTASGTIRARAKFDNPNGLLVPGMFVSVRFSGDGEQNAITVPQQAIGSDQNKKYVYVVDQENKVKYREVELGKEVGSNRIVLSGLNPGDRVIVRGLQFIRPDQTVEAKEL